MEDVIQVKFLKKVYCRLYQAGFRAAIPILPYREPTPIEGFDGVVPVLRQHGIERILLVTDPGVYGLGLTKPLEESFQAANIHCAVYARTKANPTDKDVFAAAELYRHDDCQALIAVGGGSAMDCAKAAGAVIAHPNWPMKRIKGNLKLRHKLPLLIAVPTTAGTGSETTLAAVITDDKTHIKRSINDFHLIPRYAVLEPRVTVGLPRHLTATTGMDALTHAVEAFIGRSTTKDTRADAIEAVKLIFRYLPRACEVPGDLEARSNMLRASYLAGLAFTKSYVGYVHALAHSLGGWYGTAHGLANSVLLPYVLEAYGAHAQKRLAKLSRAVGLSPETEDDRAAAERFIAKIWSMNAALGIPKTISDLKEEDIPQLARIAEDEGNPLYPVPVEWEVEQFEEMYHLVLEDAAHGTDRIGTRKTA